MNLKLVLAQTYLTSVHFLMASNNVGTQLITTTGSALHFKVLSLCPEVCEVLLVCTSFIFLLLLFLFFFLLFFFWGGGGWQMVEAICRMFFFVFSFYRISRNEFPRAMKLNNRNASDVHLSHMWSRVRITTESNQSSFMCVFLKDRLQKLLFATTVVV